MINIGSLHPLTSFVIESVRKFSGVSQIGNPIPKILSGKLCVEYTITSHGDEYTIALTKEKDRVTIAILPPMVNTNPSDYDHTNNLVTMINTTLHYLEKHQSTIFGLFPKSTTPLDPS